MNKMAGPTRRLTQALAVGAVCLSSCAVGPQFQKPVTPVGDHWLPDGEAALGLNLNDPQGEWWQDWHSGQLDELIKQALKHSPTIALAESNLKAAHALEMQSVAALFPTVTVGGQASRNRDAVNVLSPALTNGDAVYRLNSGQLSVGWAVDVFGASRRAVEAAHANAESQRWLTDAARLLLSANVAVTAVAESALRQETQLWAQAEADALEMLTIQRQARDAGSISAADLAQEQAAYASVQAQSAMVVQKWRVTQDQRAVYLGALPPERMESLALESIQPSASIPVGVPSGLLTRRPDVRAAEAALHAATANVGVSIADLLPQVMINGALGSTNTGPLFKSNTGFWTGSVGLTQSVFAGGALWQKVVGARAALDGAGAQYRLAVLTAIQNTQDALWTLETDQKAYQAAKRSTEAALVVKTITEQKCALGDASRYQCLQAKSAWEQAQAAEWQARATVLADRALLSVAVAGPLPRDDRP